MPNLVLGKVAHCIGCRIVIVFSCDDKPDFDAGATQKYQADAKEPCGELSVTTSSVQQVSSVLSATLSGLFNVTFAAFDRHCISYLVQFVLRYSFCLETFIFAYGQKLCVHFFCFFLKLQTQLLNNGKTPKGELCTYANAIELIDNKHCSGKVHCNSMVVSCFA